MDAEVILLLSRSHMRHEWEHKSVWRRDEFAYLESLWRRLAYHQSSSVRAAHHDHLACE
jgi:hypothetical protein